MLRSTKRSPYNRPPFFSPSSRDPSKHEVDLKLTGKKIENTSPLERAIEGVLKGDLCNFDGPSSDNQAGFKDEDGECQPCPPGQTCDGKAIKMCDAGYQPSLVGDCEPCPEGSECSMNAVDKVIKASKDATQVVDAV